MKGRAGRGVELFFKSYPFEATHTAKPMTWGGGEDISLSKECSITTMTAIPPGVRTICLRGLRRTARQ